MAKIKVNFMIEPEWWEAIRDAAGDLRISKSEWLRRAISTALIFQTPSEALPTPTNAPDTEGE